MDDKLKKAKGKENLNSMFNLEYLVVNKETVKYTYKQIESILDRYGSKSSPNYSQAYIAYISPDDFLSLTTSNLAKIERESRELNLKDLQNETQDIFLKFDMDNKEVTGHEGRHRMVALRNSGVKYVPVVLWQNGEKGKYNKTFIENLRLTGEEFVYSKAPGNVDIKNLVPASRSFEEYLKRDFADFEGCTKEKKSMNDLEKQIDYYKANCIVENNNRVKKESRYER